MYNYEFLDILVYKKIESLKDDPWKLATYVCGGLMANDDHNPDHQSCEECALNAICHSSKDKLHVENLADWLMKDYSTIKDKNGEEHTPEFVFESVCRNLAVADTITKSILESLGGEETIDEK